MAPDTHATSATATAVLREIGLLSARQNLHAEALHLIIKDNEIALAGENRLDLLRLVSRAMGHKTFSAKILEVD